MKNGNNVKNTTVIVSSQHPISNHNMIFDKKSINFTYQYSQDRNRFPEIL